MGKCKHNDVIFDTKLLLKKEKNAIIEKAIRRMEMTHREDVKAVKLGCLSKSA